MIPRVAPAGRQADLEPAVEHFAKPVKIRPWPGPKPVFVTDIESRPGRIEWKDLCVPPEPLSQFLGIRFGKHRDFESLRRGPNKRRGNDQVTQSPEFDDEQFWFQNGLAQ